MASSKRIFLSPAPRLLKDIFDDADLARLRALGELVIHESGPVTEKVFAEGAADAEIIIGQIDLPPERLDRARNLRALFNVEGNLLQNIDYADAARRGIRVLVISPVFAEPVAEEALGLAIDLARGLTRSDRAFRRGGEPYGLEANKDAYTLYDQQVGFIGMGDLGRALRPLLVPFRTRVRAFDPWLPAEYLRSLGCEPASLEDVLRLSRTVFVVAGVTSQNQGFLGAAHFGMMQPGASLLLLSRAAVVDFDAMLDFAERGHIRVATDVYPEEPLSPGHRARKVENAVLCAHMAGALHHVLHDIGRYVVADAELVMRGLPPVMCKVAQPETASLFRARAVSKS